MTTFKYAAKDPGGKTVEGTIDAADREEVLNELRGQNLVVMKPRADRRPAAAVGRRAPRERAASPAPRAKRQRDAPRARALHAPARDHGGGGPLAPRGRSRCSAHQAETAALEGDLRGPRAARCAAGPTSPRPWSAAPRPSTSSTSAWSSAGEVSGQMDVILERLADYQEAAEALRREIKSAMTYPVISMVLVTGHHGLPDDRRRARLPPGLRLAGHGAAGASRQVRARRRRTSCARTGTSRFGGMVAFFGGLSAFKKTDAGSP